MAYNEELATRIRAALERYPLTFTEKKMFGGLSFLYHGKMTIGILKNELAVHVLQKHIDKMLTQPNVRPMYFTKRPIKEFVYVALKSFTKKKMIIDSLA
jgi:TfoX/Sxy family transcriptional regulator of competence genes